MIIIIKLIPLFYNVCKKEYDCIEVKVVSGLPWGFTNLSPIQPLALNPE
jgi:hypothetical protein